MTYQYKSEVVNNGDENTFFDKNNFVGYILPDGSIYECKNHNIENVSSFLKMSLDLFKDHYNEREEFIEGDTNSPLIGIVSRYLKRISYDEGMALKDFIKKNNITISDLLVGLFGCHLVTRLNKTILTSASNLDIFYNYMLHDFKINTIDRMVYDEEKKSFVLKKNLGSNIELEQEINQIKKDSYSEERGLFHKR